MQVDGDSLLGWLRAESIRMNVYAAVGGNDAQVMSNTQLEELLAAQPPEIREEIVRINTDARPIALQVALIIPIIAGLPGLLNAFRMTRLPDPVAAGSGEAMALG